MSSAEAAASAADWTRVSRRIAEETGLHFPPRRHADLQRGFSEAATELGFPDGATCADALIGERLSPAQLRAVARHLTIGETSFFRDPPFYDALRGKILPELIRLRRGREQRLRLWSAACSTGEEPYSLAILLHQVLPDWRDWNITLLATDLNERSLQTALAGEYGEWSFRSTPPAIRDRYFRQKNARRYEIAAEIRDCVTFAQLNLARDAYPSPANGTTAMDLILCRNVLMYFTPEHTGALVRNLHSCLEDDAWLAVSPSECSQKLFASFDAVNLDGALFYRKRSAAARTKAQPGRPEYSEQLEARELREDTRAPAPLDGGHHTAVPLEGSHHTATGPLHDARRPASAPPELRDVQGARLFSRTARVLANEGRLREALTWTERWLACEKLDPAAHYLNAMIHQELGEIGAARRALRRTLFLDPNFVLAHFALGHLARSELQISQARLYFDTTLQLLRRLPEEQRVPESDGLTAGQLREVVSTLISTMNDTRDAANETHDAPEH